MYKKIIIGAVILIALGALFWFRLPSREKKSDEDAPRAVSSEPQEQKEVQLLMAIIKEGVGERTAQSGDTLQVHYIGAFQDGKVFDSSRARGEPFRFTLGAGQVIQGWDAGLEGMKEGEIRRLIIPPELAYGSHGAGDVIPPDTTLVFEVELLSIQ